MMEKRWRSRKRPRPRHRTLRTLGCSGWNRRSKPCSANWMRSAANRNSLLGRLKRPGAAGRRRTAIVPLQETHPFVAKDGRMLGAFHRLGDRAKPETVSQAQEMSQEYPT